MNMGIKHTTASSSSLILCLESVFGILFSMIFYHERPTLQTAVGFVIIFVGIVLNETKPKFALKRIKRPLTAIMAKNIIKIVDIL